MAIRGIIFDFDGLILDTEGPIFQSWQELYREQGGNLDLAIWSKVIGTAEGSFDLFDLLESQCGRELDREALHRRQRAREAALIAVQVISPGVLEYLSSARRMGLKIGLASSSSRQWVTGHLERLGLLPFFDCLRTSDDVEVTKPDPALYLAALSGLGLRAGQAIALEDSPNGVLAAKRAGLFCVAVPNPLTRQLSLEHADLVLDSLDELPLPDLLSRLNGGPSLARPPIPG